MNPNFKTIELGPREQIVAVVPEYVSGPGWSNAITWVYIREGNKFRVEDIQPEERSDALHVLFNVGADMQLALKAAVMTVQVGLPGITNEPHGDMDEVVSLRAENRRLRECIEQKDMDICTLNLKVNKLLGRK